jgi:hypothetical protein
MLPFDGTEEREEGDRGSCRVPPLAEKEKHGSGEIRGCSEGLKVRQG